MRRVVKEVELDTPVTHKRALLCKDTLEGGILDDFQTMHLGE